MTPTSNVVQISDYRKTKSDVPEMDQSMDESDKVKFAVDVVADQWAGELVHEMMMSFAERGTDIDFSDPVYGKLMEGVADVVRSMTRHHLDVFDETALMLQKYPESEVSVGIITLNEDHEDYSDD